VSRGLRSLAARRPKGRDRFAQGRALTPLSLSLAGACVPSSLPPPPHPQPHRTGGGGAADPLLGGASSSDDPKQQQQQQQQQPRQGAFTTAVFGVLYTLAKEKIADSKAVALLSVLVDFFLIGGILLLPEYPWALPPGHGLQRLVYYVEFHLPIARTVASCLPCCCCCCCFLGGRG
jgi:hypothetical protein